MKAMGKQNLLLVEGFLGSDFIDQQISIHPIQDESNRKPELLVKVFIGLDFIDYK